MAADGLGNPARSCCDSLGNTVRSARSCSCSTPSARADSLGHQLRCSTPSIRSSPHNRRGRAPSLHADYDLGGSSEEELSPRSHASRLEEARASPSACSRPSRSTPLGHFGGALLTHMGTGMSRTSMDRNVTRTNMQKFEVSRREACALVRKGEVLEKHPVNRTDGGRFSSLREMRRKPGSLLKRTKRYSFVVLDRHKTASGHPELRWDIDPEVAESQEARGCLVLSDVHYVTATVLEDDSEQRQASEKLLREFQIVCAGYTLKLVAPTRESMKLWVVGLLQLSSLAKRRNIKFTRTVVDDVLWNTIVQEFERLDKDGSGDLSQSELADLMQTMGGTAHTAGQLLSEFDADGNGSLQLQEFARLFQAFAVKEVLAPWFQRYAKPVITDSGMQTMGVSEADFQEFLEAEQGEVDVSAGSVLMKLQDPHVVLVNEERHLTELGFSHLLCSAKNPAFDPARRQKVHQDMTKPLSQYWISSSHNTYLQSDQLFGKSALEQYIEVLLRGCRCVEIDCWDGEEGEPIVTHGYTATSRLMFQDVVRVCRDYGFVASPYPLILSLEVHCGPRQLARMGQILNDVLGEQLLKLPEGGLASAELASPAAAMRKVIVKGKMPHDICSDALYESSRSAASLLVQPRALPKSGGGGRNLLSPFRECIKSLTSRRRRSRRVKLEDTPEMVPPATNDKRGGSPLSVSEGIRRDDSFMQRSTSICAKYPTFTSQDSASVISMSIRSSAPTRTSRTSGSARRLLRHLSWGKSVSEDSDTAGVQDYARTLYLVAKKAPKNFPAEGDSGLLPCNIVSLNELKAGKMLEESADRARELHRRNLSRVYPRASRTSSSNFDPVPFWLAGVQMVALNYQSMDLPVLLNEGLFRNENGGSGYILKPDLSPSRALECDVSVGVLCGQYLPKPLGGSTNPTVRISICGADRQTVMTKQVLDNGFNPRWEETFSFNLERPDTSMLVFEVVHSAPARKSVLTRLRGGKLSATKAKSNKLCWPGRQQSMGGGMLRRSASRSGPGESKRLLWRRRPQGGEEVVAAAAVPVNGLREGLRWIQLLDSRFHPIERCGLLLDLRLGGPWAEDRRAAAASLSTGLADSTRMAVACLTGEEMIVQTSVDETFSI